MQVNYMRILQYRFILYMLQKLTLGELISRGEETSRLDSSSGNVFSPLCLAKIISFMQVNESKDTAT